MTAPLLLLSIVDCVVVPFVISVAEDSTDIVPSIVVVLENVSGVISPGVDACDIVGSVGVGRAPVRYKQNSILYF